MSVFDFNSRAVDSPLELILGIERKIHNSLRGDFHIKSRSSQLHPHSSGRVDHDTGSNAAFLDIDISPPFNNDIACRSSGRDPHSPHSGNGCGSTS